MLRICRAEDGYSVEVEWDGGRTTALETFLSTHTNVPAEAIVAYTSDGKRVGSAVAGIGASGQGAPEPTAVYVFNTQYLEMTVTELVRALHVDADVALLTSTPTTSTISTLRVLHASLHTQHAGLLAASRNLALNVLAITDVWAGIEGSISAELYRQVALIRGVKDDLKVIKSIKIHPHLIQGGAGRALGDYVSVSKMEQVCDACRRANEELRGRFDRVLSSVALCVESEAQIRDITTSKGRFSDADAILEHAKGGEDEVRDMVDLKNALTKECVALLKRITEVNGELTNIPSMMVTLQASFKQSPASQSQQLQQPPLNLKNFSHLHRLHSMLFAYGATLIEIVRRREFEAFLTSRGQGVVEVFAKITSAERKRRSAFRSEVGGLLPFEVLGIEGSVPAVEIDLKGLSTSLTQQVDGEYGISRADIAEFMHLLDSIEDQLVRDDGDATGIREARVGLENLIAKMDGVERGWERVVERGLLSSSGVSTTLHSRRRSEADTQAYNEIVDELRRVEDERRALREELERGRRREESLCNQLGDTQKDAEETRNEMSALQDQLSTTCNELHRAESEVSAARADIGLINAQSQQTESRLRDEKGKSRDLERAVVERDRTLADYEARLREHELRERERRDHLAEADGDRAILERESERLRSEIRELQGHVKAKDDELVAARDDMSHTEGQLQDTHVQLELAKEEIDSLRGEVNMTKRLLEESTTAKKRVDKELRDVKEKLAEERGDAIGLREELSRVEALVRQQEQSDDEVLREAFTQIRDLEAQLHDTDSRLETSERLVAQLVDVGLSYRTAHNKVQGMVQGMVAHPSTRRSGEDTSLPASGSFVPSTSPFASTNLLHLTIDEPLPTTPEDVLELLRAWDHDVFVDNVARVGGVLRRWMKQCKEYRERAKGRISFRNFGKGDLALFLPTRGNGGVEGKGKGWAAFNVFFPHYFLQPTGPLAEQLKTREWIVARITEITERLATNKAAADGTDGNPYGLGEGVKYYMLQVEDWTQQGGGTGTSSTKNRRKSRGNSETQPSFLRASPDREFLKPPPEASEDVAVEDTFPVPSTMPSSMPPPPNEGAGRGGSPRGRPSSLSRLLAQADADTDEVNNGLRMTRAEDASSLVPRLLSPILRSGSPVLKTSSPISRTSSPVQRTGSPIARLTSPTVPAHFFPSKLSSSPQQIPVTLPSVANMHASSSSSSPANLPASASPRPFPSISTSPTSKHPLASPLRPGSRASKTSSTSRFSLVGGKLPVGTGGGKSAPTTGTTTGVGEELETPSPGESISEGLAGVGHRRSATVTASTSTGSARGALASLASSWGVAFGRRRSGDEDRRRTVSNVWSAGGDSDLTTRP